MQAQRPLLFVQYGSVTAPTDASGGTLPADVTILEGRTATLTASNLLQGIYVFELTVTDNGGNTATDQVTITVNPAAVNQNPTANAGTDQSLTLPVNSTNLPAR